MADDALPDYVRALLEPDAYPHAPDEIELRQTHISYVFLSGDVVYKTKKPVDFGFIQQLDAVTRERFCSAEVALNRRLAPDVYIDVVPIMRTSDGRFVVEGDIEGAGEIVEHAVKMRRLPDDRTLDQLLAANAAPEDVIEQIADRVVALHAGAEVVANDPSYAGVAAERAWWEREYDEAKGFISGTWRAEDAAALEEFVAQTIDTQAAIFDERLAAGRVVEGHGDLQAKHVYVLPTETGTGAEQITIVDCVEFNDWFHFRYLDVGYDVAFLAMDLEALGRPDLGDEFAGRYIAATGDETIGVLQPLHRAFRAYVRGKVESIGAGAPEVPPSQQAELAASAARYFRLAAEYAERRSGPALVILAGLSGTGKTLVGATLAGRIGAAHVSSDVIRHELAEAAGLSTAMWQKYEAGAYSAEMSQRTYSEMRKRAAAHLAAGRPVILDAMHGRALDRAAAAHVAREAGVPTVIAELRLSDDDTFARLAQREREANNTEVDRLAYQRHVESYEMVNAGEAQTHLALDASQPPAEIALEIAESLPPAK
jgi:aminoglycoside phosphotransferase family enzyme/predicted kinase